MFLEKNWILAPLLNTIYVKSFKKKDFFWNLKTGSTFFVTGDFQAEKNNWFFFPRIFWKSKEKVLGCGLWRHNKHFFGGQERPWFCLSWFDEFFYWMEDNSVILALQSKEERVASVNFKENGCMNLDQSSVLSNFNTFWMYETGSAMRYL